MKKSNILLYGIAAVLLIFYVVVLGISMDTSGVTDEYRAYYLEQ